MAFSALPPSPSRGPLGEDPLSALRQAWTRLQNAVLQDQPQAAAEAAVDFASTACFCLRNHGSKGPRSERQTSAAAYLRIDELFRSCWDLSDPESPHGKVRVEATEDLVSATVLFEKTAPCSAYAVHVEFRDGSRHEVLQFASRVLGAWSSYFAA